MYPSYQAKHHTTVRYAFSFVFLSALIGGFAMVASHNTSYITIEASDETVAQDQQFYIDVTVFAHIPVNAVNIVLTYPDNALVVDGIDTGTSVITLWNKEPYAEKGKIYLQGGTFRKGFIGSHQIARIRVHAQKSGDAKIILNNTELIAGDGNGTRVQTENTGKNIITLAVTGSDGVLTGRAEIGVVTDVNGDGEVDLSDISSFMAAWISHKKTFDFNNDGMMTFSDFSILLAESFYR